MKKRIIIIGSFLFLTMLAEESLSAYAHLDWGVNFIGLKNKPFRQSANYRGQFRYNQSVGFPTLSLDMGIMSGKVFRFLRHDNNFICGLKIMVSNTAQKISGEFLLENVNAPELGFVPSGFLVRHDFNVAAFSPYIGVVLNNGQYRYGLTGGVTVFDKMLDKLEAHEVTLSAGYTGIHLRPLDRALGGTLRAFVDRQGEYMFGGISYEYTRATQQYWRHIFIERSDALVADFLTRLHLIPGINEMEISEAPTIQIGIHTLSVYVGFRV